MKLALIHAICLAGLLGGCASAPSVPSAVRNELAPAAKLRVGLILSNQVLVTKDPQTGELRGVTVALGKKLAERLGVPFEPVGYPNPAALARSFGANELDIAFLAFDPARAQEVDFSPPYMAVDSTYLVPAGSKLQSADTASRPEIKIAVPEVGPAILGAMDESRAGHSATKLSDGRVLILGGYNGSYLKSARRA